MSTRSRRAARPAQSDTEIDSAAPVLQNRVIEDLSADDGPKLKGIVAPGRTVEAPIPGSRRFVGYSPDGAGNAIYGPEYTHYGPGEEVEVPARDMKRLQELGFIVDPKRRLDQPPQGRPTNERKPTASRPRQNGAHISA